MPTGLPDWTRQGFIILQIFKGIQNGVKAIPVAGSLAAPAVDHQLQRPLGHLWIQVVLDHAVDGFRLPGFTGEFGTGGRLGSGGDWTWVTSNYGINNGIIQ